MADQVHAVAISPVAHESAKPFVFNQINDYVPDTEKNGTFEGKPNKTPQEVRDKNAEAINPIHATSEHTTSASELETNSTEDLGTIDEIQKPVSSTPEPESKSTENDSPSDSIAFDNFFHTSTGHSSFQDNCPTLVAYCGWLWYILDKPYSIPLWLLLMAAPVSAAVMGALHMHSCPGATNLAIMVFSMGISFSAAFLIKIIFILLKVLDEEENWKPLFKTFFGIAAIITIGLCMTESVYFWKMDSAPDPHSTKYCDPQLTAYAFWWNCFLWVNVVILFFCQG